MGKKRKYNWDTIKEKISLSVASGDLRPTYSGIAKMLGIPITTVRDNIDVSEFNGLWETPYADLGVAGLRMKTASNVTTGTVESNHPTTQAEMAKLMGINLEDWIVKSFECRARQVVIRDSEKDLQFEEGRITGFSTDQGPRLATVWMTIMTVTPKTIEAPEIVLKRIEFPMPDPDDVYVGQTKQEKEVTVTLAIPDLHVGFVGSRPMHNRQFMTGVLNLIQSEKPDVIVLLGDVQDLAEFTDTFVKDPDTIRTTQNGLIETANFLAKIRALTDGLIFYIEGNHEARLRRSIRKHLGALAGLSAHGEEVGSIPSLLGLANLGVEYIGDYPNGEITIGDVTYVHGDIVGSQPGQAAAKMLAKYNRSVVFGHIHRFELVWDNAYSDLTGRLKPVFAFSPGHGGQAKYIPGSKAYNAWNSGVGFITTRPNGQSTVNPVIFSDGHFLI